MKSSPRKGDRYRVAVIGTGMIATDGHIPAWKHLSQDVEIVAVADLQEDRAKLVARTEGIPLAFGDWRRMLAEAEPDIVSVCTPNAFHREPTVAALEAGAHVLCEKDGGNLPRQCHRNVHCREKRPGGCS